MRSLILCGVFILSLLLAHGEAVACPLQGGITDFNCDGEGRVLFLGDSLVFGVGDERNNGEGGYTLRLKKKFKNATISSYGVPGITTRALLSDVNRSFSSSNELFDTLTLSDVVVLDLGRNDRWNFEPPKKTYRNLKRIRKVIQRKTKRAGYTSPFVVTAVLMLPNRGSQGPWVKELNEVIKKSNSKQAPADLRFDQVSKTLLNKDQIHPTSAGYTALTKVATRYLKTRLKRKVKRVRPDRDKDDVYDDFEISRFGTDPTLIDTDGDGSSDGSELFTSMTDPLDPSSF